MMKIVDLNQLPTAVAPFVASRIEALHTILEDSTTSFTARDRAIFNVLLHGFDISCMHTHTDLIRNVYPVTFVTHIGTSLVHVDTRDNTYTVTP